ncbi:hypothetical protein AVEN_82576-1 [Araneus ventricosus]|uniref:Uncharacterized protein n=1 Tax=Araneus ventricosus TaxID=182803 RepID=A0A4Y2IWQ1_ARAVE|nr:hypothetical protein AVEN_82576-1 [Araneus ventricosus]
MGQLFRSRFRLFLISLHTNYDDNRLYLVVPAVVNKKVSSGKASEWKNILQRTAEDKVNCLHSKKLGHQILLSTTEKSRAEQKFQNPLIRSPRASPYLCRLGKASCCHWSASHRERSPTCG